MYKWLILLIVIFSFGCAPKPFEPFEPPKVEFEETEEYSVDLDSIPKPEPPDPIFVNDDFEQVSPDDATLILFTKEEYAKISALVRLTSGYKDIILEQEQLVNVNVDIINSLKEYLELENQKTLSYRELWINSENMYRYEQWRNDWNERINKGTWGVISIGTMILFGLSL